MDTTKERIPEKVTLELSQKLVEIVNNDPDDFNSLCMNGMNCVQWSDLLRIFIKLKILYIIYARLIGKIDLLVWSVEGNPLLDSVSCSDDLDYETISEGLMELRWSSWNPDEASTEITLSDAIQEMTSEEDIDLAILGLKVDTATEEEIQMLIPQVEDLTDTVVELVSKKATQEYLLELLSQNDRTRKSTFFQRCFKNSIDPSDLLEVAELFIKFWSQWAAYDLSECGVDLRIRKLPWIHKVLAQTELLVKNEAAVRLIQNEIDSLVLYGYCCRGKQSVYCIEMVMDTEESYEHYPSLFTPFKLTVLELLAKEICKANDAQVLPDVIGSET